MTTPADREHRVESRLKLAETIFIEVLSTAADHQEGSRIVICNSLDLSANGLQVVVDEEIPVTSRLRLCIDIHDRDPVYLVGEVIWQRRDDESEGHRIGFSLFESDDTDIRSWQEVIADLLN
ncbi:MAG TPA: PilZ domain-containing protein [Pseudomonadales bacterium]|nr:PilZ domain-containing protein [Pseudomonadales bacterium]